MTSPKPAMGATAARRSPRGTAPAARAAAGVRTTVVPTTTACCPPRAQRPMPAPGGSQRALPGAVHRKGTIGARREHALELWQAQEASGPEPAGDDHGDGDDDSDLTEVGPIGGTTVADGHARPGVLALGHASGALGAVPGDWRRCHERAKDGRGKDAREKHETDRRTDNPEHANYKDELQRSDFSKACLGQPIARGTASARP